MLQIFIFEDEVTSFEMAYIQSKFHQDKYYVTEQQK